MDKFDLLNIQKSNNLPSKVDRLERLKSFFSEDNITCLPLKDYLKFEGVVTLLSKNKIEVNSPIPFSELIYSQSIRQKLERYLSDTKDSVALNSTPPVLALRGATGYGKDTLINSIAVELQFPIQAKDAPIIPGTCILVFDDMADLVQYQKNDGKSNVLIFCEEVNDALVVSAKAPVDLFQFEVSIVEICLNRKSYRSGDVISALIKSLLLKSGFVGEIPNTVYESFIRAGVETSPGAIDLIVNRAKWHSESKKIAFEIDSLNYTLSEYKDSRSKESSVVKVITPVKGRSDLIVDKELALEIDSIIFRGKNLNKGSHKFLSKLRTGSRLNILLSGVPGTGKSLSAEVIAKELGLELWIVNLDSLMSAYQGETEKNISDLFLKAQTAGVVLLLDEADSMFMQRNGKQADHQRRISNHILCEIEDYRGIFIATTNAPLSFDEASNRRFDKKIKFLNPGLATMIELLKSLLYPDAPISDDIDFSSIFNGLSISGGFIRNAVEMAYYESMEAGELVIGNKRLRDCLEKVSREKSLMQEDSRKVGF